MTSNGKGKSSVDSRIMVLGRSAVGKSGMISYFFIFIFKRHFCT